MWRSTRVCLGSDEDRNRTNVPSVFQMCVNKSELSVMLMDAGCEPTQKQLRPAEAFIAETTLPLLDAWTHGHPQGHGGHAGLKLRSQHPPRKGGQKGTNEQVFIL